MFKTLHELGIDFVIRVRGNIELPAANGTVKKTADWVTKSGRARKLDDVRITADETERTAFVAVHAKRMKDPWRLASSLGEAATDIVKVYGKRFSIEETFRDNPKDNRFGLGLSATRIGTPSRRDRLLLLCALAYPFIVTLGQAAEDAGLDRLLKGNTAKARQLSLFNQGLRWLEMLPRTRENWKTPLLEAFMKRIRAQQLGQLMLAELLGANYGDDSGTGQHPTPLTSGRTAPRTPTPRRSSAPPASPAFVPNDCSRSTGRSRARRRSR
jgi:hypothetical protein